MGWHRRPLVWLCAALPAAALAGPEFRAALQPPAARLGGQALLTIEASWQEQGGKSYRVLAPQMPEPKKLQLAHIAAEATSAPAGAGVQHLVRFVCTLKPTETGDAETGEIQVRYLSTDVAQAVSEAAGADAETPAAVHKIPSLKVRVSSRTAVWVWICLAAVAAAALAAAAGVVLVLIKRARAQMPAPPAAGSLEAECLNQLHTLRTLRIAGDAKAYVGGLSQVLARYVRAKFAAAASDKAELASRLGAGRAERVAQIAAAAENIRYAGSAPLPEELGRMASFVEDLLREHMPDSQHDLLKGVKLKS
jgi:hypothetical protein